jgi:hypothetical protein
MDRREIKHTNKRRKYRDGVNRKKKKQLLNNSEQFPKGKQTLNGNAENK